VQHQTAGNKRRKDSSLAWLHVQKWPIGICAEKVAIHRIPASPEFGDGGCGERPVEEIEPRLPAAGATQPEAHVLAKSEPTPMRPAHRSCGTLRSARRTKELNRDLQVRRKRPGPELSSSVPQRTTALDCGRLRPTRARRTTAKLSGLESRQRSAALHVDRHRDMVVRDEPVGVDLPKARRPPNPVIDAVPVLQRAADLI